MYRLELVLFLLSFLPLTMAVIFVMAVAPRRQENIDKSLQAAAAPPAVAEGKFDPQTTLFITQAMERVRKDFDSLSGLRLLIPALLLSVLYAVGFSFGISTLMPASYHGLFCRPITLFNARVLLDNPSFAVLGAFTFNTGVLVRRAFMADFTKNVMWACLNRLVISVGFSIFLYVVPSTWTTAHGTMHALSFAIAFFPRVFFTFLRKQTRKALGFADGTSELEIQLIQGIDVWKEERLEEEGIESVQNMATVDIFDLLPKVHYPLRTIVDWMDQAIFIQRFPLAYKKLRDAGYPVSARLMGQIGGEINPDPALLANMAEVSGIAAPVLHESLQNLGNDAVVRVLDRLWQSGAIT